jgi:hypothetical protein
VKAPNEKDLPTLKQIMFAADGIGQVPMDEQESQEWFELTCKSNRERREKLERERAKE